MTVPQDPPAPTTYVPVRRIGEPSGKRVHASRGKLSPITQVTYDDGVTVRVKLARQRSETGSGPGAFPGRRLTEAEITFRNKSTRVLDLTQVVVTTTYGKPALLASAVYDESAPADFGGTVKPGGTATAGYAFAIPKPGVPITIIVDWDASHEPAVVSGESN